MAEINITNVSNSGLHLSFEPHVRIIDRDWPGGGKVPVVEIGFANDTVRIWPADANDLEALGNKLIAIAAKLKADPRSGW